MAVKRAPRSTNPFDLGVSLSLDNLAVYGTGGGGKRGRDKARDVSLSLAWLRVCGSWQGHDSSTHTPTTRLVPPSCPLQHLSRPPPAPQDAKKKHKPDPGATAGVGRAGRIGSTGGTLLTQHLLKTRGKLVSTDAELDPREAILRHEGKQDDISHLTSAYAKTQPQPIFAEEEPGSSDEEDAGGR
jgi:hypothetical protein